MEVTMSMGGPIVNSVMSIVVRLPVLAFCILGPLTQSSSGPEVKSFLGFLRQEESELQFQMTHKEISRKEFTRSMNRIGVNRDAVLRFVKESGEDRVPDYNVVASAEADQLIENGARLMKNAKPADIVGGKWRFIGSETRGELFYILERVSRKDAGSTSRSEGSEFRIRQEFSPFSED